MDRVAVFVDAGYVFAQGAVLLTGHKRPRGSITLDHEACIQRLATFATGLTGVPLLRVYWYDGTSTGPTAQHLTLAHLHDVKVRLGFVNSVGEQKGVDSLIVTDMITLARNGAVCDAVLVSGDEDLRVGVQQAQEWGVRVHLLGIKPSRGSQSLFLMQEADTTHEWADGDVSSFLSCKPVLVADAAVPLDAPPAVAAANETGVAETSLIRVAVAVAQSIEPAEREALVAAYEASRQLPQDVDRRLLTQGRAILGRDLLPAEKKVLRSGFIDACRVRSA